MHLIPVRHPPRMNITPNPDTARESLYPLRDLRALCGESNHTRNASVVGLMGRSSQ